MKPAGARFEVRVTRGRDRVDSIEVVDFAQGEVVLFWDCDPRQATRMAEALRADLRRLDDGDFLAAWVAAQPGDFS